MSLVTSKRLSRAAARAAAPRPPSRRCFRRRLEGYADQQSVLAGQSFRLYVSTTARSFRVDAFRFGWYSGHQARLVWASGPVRGQRQTAVRTAAGTHMVTAPWRPSLSVSTAGWPPGAQPSAHASSGAERYVPLTVRSRSIAGKVVMLEEVTTWQAYNPWGGYDLYDGPQGFGDRSYAVSFDRPYDLTGAPIVSASTSPQLRWRKRTGVPLAYETDVDIDEHPGLLAGARAVISLGHDEYYSAAMRNAVLRARDARTNFAFLGANAMYRHIRFAASALGPDRVEIAYKVARLDPDYGRDKAATTQDWRVHRIHDRRASSPACSTSATRSALRTSFTTRAAGSSPGTGVRGGTLFPGLVGPEYDRVNPAVHVPRSLQVLAHSPVHLRGP